MSDDDFPSSAKNKDVARIKGKIDEFGKYLEKQGYCHHIFVTPREMEEDAATGNGMMAAMGKISMTTAAYLTHVGTMIQDSNYRKAALITFLMFKKGKMKVKNLSVKDDDGFLSKLKKMF